MSIAIHPLPHPEHHGDWHDKPLKWVVEGPGTERQKFATKKDASTYAKCRRHSVSFKEAQNKWMSLP